MNKFLSTITILIVFTNTALAQSVSLNPGWHLKGTQIAYTDMTDFNKSCIKYVWKYNTSSSSWSIFSPDSNIINDLTTKHVSISPLNNIEANDGFWLDVNASCNVEMNTTTANQTIQLAKGWQLNGSTIGFESMSNFNKPYIDIIWAYSENSWKAYSPNVLVAELLNNDENYKNLITLSPHDGFWVRANTTANISSNDNNFSRESKTTDSISSIWNINLYVDNNLSVANANVALHIKKIQSGTIANIIAEGISITNGEITSISKLYIYGEKTDGSAAAATYPPVSDLNNIRINSLKLKNEMLTFNLGYIIENQTVYDASSLTNPADFELSIYASEIDINAEVTTSTTTLTTSSLGGTFPFPANSQVLHGTLHIGN